MCDIAIWSNIWKSNDSIDINKKDQKYFCSQLVTAYLRYTKCLVNDNIKSHRVLPGYFSDSNDKSKLKDYTQETLLLFNTPAVGKARRKYIHSNGNNDNDNGNNGTNNNNNA